MWRKTKGWFAGKQPEPTDRVTRAAASSSSARVSYNDDIAYPGLLNETDTVCAMSYPCPEFLDSASLRDQFNSLCEAAGLTYLVTHQVPQYPKLTYYFVNWFKFNDGVHPTVEFRSYDDVITMTL